MSTLYPSCLLLTIFQFVLFILLNVFHVFVVNNNCVSFTPFPCLFICYTDHLVINSVHCRIKYSFACEIIIVCLMTIKLFLSKHICLFFVVNMTVVLVNDDF